MQKIKEIIMGFNERVHAYIAAKYYVHLKEHFEDRGVQAFIHATQYYAMQRGRRMAQRAIRDGQPLTQATYNQYGEWVNTQEIIDEGIQNKSTLSPDFKTIITGCPWHTQFKDMGLLEAGAVYCTYLDAAISRGFNPALGYTVDQNLNMADCCIHYLKDGNIAEGKELGKKKEYLKPFEYHCAHSYWAYAEVTQAIFGAEGQIVCAEVMKDFEADYGKEMADILASYKDTNFNVC